MARDKYFEKLEDYCHHPSAVMCMQLSAAFLAYHNVKTLL
jgi:hypothetical protein